MPITNAVQGVLDIAYYMVNTCHIKIKQVGNGVTILSIHLRCHAFLRTFFMSKLKALRTFQSECWDVCCQETSYDMFLITKQTPFHFLSNFKSQEYER